MSDDKLGVFSMQVQKQRFFYEVEGVEKYQLDQF